MEVTEYEEELGGLSASQLKNIPGGMINLPPDHDTFAGNQGGYNPSYLLGNPTGYLQSQIEQTPQMNNKNAEEFTEETLGRPPKGFTVLENKETQVEMLA